MGLQRWIKLHLILSHIENARRVQVSSLITAITNVQIMQTLYFNSITITHNMSMCQDAQYEYPDNGPAAVSFDKAWGYCDKKCFLTRENIVANNLQEVCHHNVIEYVEYRG